MEPFIISFWHDPPVELARYQELADCGFTLAASQAPTPQVGRQVLDLCQQVGIKALIIDPRIRANLPQQAHWEQTVRQVVADYAGHLALWGYYLTDEPGLNQFENLARLHTLFRQLDSQAVPYINLFPNYANCDQLGTVDYRVHVRRFVEMVQPLYLSYDHYAFFEERELPVYFENLEIIRQEALRAGIPFWNVILSCALFSYRDPTPADLRYGVYTTLVYGGKALGYYTYWTQDGYSFRDGPISMYGHRSEKYALLQQLNLEMQHLGPWLNKLISTGVSHWPDAPQGTTLLDGQGLVAEVSGGEFVIGEFRDDKGLPWLMVTNRDRDHSVWVTLKLRTQMTEISEVSRSTGELRPIARDAGTKAAAEYTDGMTVQFWLAPADGRLMQLSSPREQ
jgi:hypothetical protein